MGVVDQPYFLLQSLQGAEYVRNTEAQTLVTANPGCLLQMKAGIHKAGLSKQMRAVHIVDLLSEARGQASSAPEQ